MRLGTSSKTVYLSDRVFALMGLEVTDDNILSLPLEVLCFLQHAERLADSSGIAQEHFQLAPGTLPAILLSISANVDRRRHRFLRQRGSDVQLSCAKAEAIFLRADFAPIKI